MHALKPPASSVRFSGLSGSALHQLQHITGLESTRLLLLGAWCTELPAQRATGTRPTTSQRHAWRSLFKQLDMSFRVIREPGSCEPDFSTVPSARAFWNELERSSIMGTGCREGAHTVNRSSGHAAAQHLGDRGDDWEIHLPLPPLSQQGRVSVPPHSDSDTVDVGGGCMAEWSCGTTKLVPHRMPTGAESSYLTDWEQDARRLLECIRLTKRTPNLPLATTLGLLRIELDTRELLQTWGREAFGERESWTEHTTLETTHMALGWKGAKSLHGATCAAENAPTQPGVTPLEVESPRQVCAELEVGNPTMGLSGLSDDGDDAHQELLWTERADVDSATNSLALADPDCLEHCMLSDHQVLHELPDWNADSAPTSGLVQPQHISRFSVLPLSREVHAASGAAMQPAGGQICTSVRVFPHLGRPPDWWGMMALQPRARRRLPRYTHMLCPHQW